MRLTWGRIMIGGATLALSIVVAIFTVSSLWSGPRERRPALAETPPLRAAVRTSVVVMPAAIALTAIRDKMEKEVPLVFTEKRDNLPAQLPSKAEPGWTLTRGPLGLSGQPDVLAVSTAFNMTLRTTGQGVSRDGNSGGPPGGNPQQGSQYVGEGGLDLRGNVTMTARPALLPAWRIEPNLTSQISVGEASVSVLGANVSLSNEMKPLLDRVVGEQTALLQTRMRDDPLLETAAQSEWVKMCRSFPLEAVAAGMPRLWLELRPTRAFAGQPRISERALTLTIGLQAETRIVPSETKPDCPFPARIELVPQVEQGRVNIAVPIDVPFTEINRLLAARLKGKTFSGGPGSAFTATVRSARLAVSGDRLLVSLDVRARERMTWFGLGASATIHVWGRPVLDRGRQMLRLEQVSLDVESAAAFGLLGATARAAVPYLEKALAENAVVDLKPFAANARKSIEAALADFRRSADGVTVDAAVTSLRLVGIEFDAKTLRAIAEADGTVRAAVAKLP